MEDMLRKALRGFLGLLKQLLTNLLGDEGEIWEKELKRFLRKEPCWSSGQVAQAPAKPCTNLLELVSAVGVAATMSKFIAKEKFVCDTGHKAKVKISYLGDNFRTWFLSGDGKTEDPISEQTLCYAKLRKASVDGPIIEELGGEAKVETTLSEMFSLMEKQKNGEDGVLLNNGYANIFYIKDQNGVLRAVRVRWFGDGWLVRAFSVEIPLEWSADHRVFSRNSVLESSESSAPAQA